MRLIRCAVRLVWVAVCWSVIGVTAAVVLALTVPMVFNARPYTVLSGSMEPTIMTGDVVVVQHIKPWQARLGDVVTFQDPRNPQRLITHRVRGIQLQGRKASFITRGDANTTTENWRVAKDGSIARVVYRIPEIGRLVFAAQDPVVRLFLIVMPAVMLALWALGAIWRSGGETPEPEAPEAAR
jgi:signal peptidase